MNRENAGGILFCVGHAYLDKSLHGRQDCYCLITEFRHEATSHGVRNNRTPTQVPEAARRVGKMPPLP